MATTHPEPPEELDGPLELDPEDWPPRALYLLLTGLVVPRPIAWVSTLGHDGTPNVAPHSYFNAVGHQPPHVMFSSSGRKDTLVNVESSGEFVVNLVTREVFAAMNVTAANLPPDEDEFSWAGLTPEPAQRVKPPRVAESRAHLECRVAEIVPAGDSSLVLGEVVHLHVDPSVWRAGRVDPRLLDPIARLGGSYYADLGTVYRLPRPSWTDLEGTEPPFPPWEPEPRA